MTTVEVQQKSATLPPVDDSVVLPPTVKRAIEAAERAHKAAYTPPLDPAPQSTADNTQPVTPAPQPTPDPQAQPAPQPTAEPAPARAPAEPAPARAPAEPAVTAPVT